MKVPLYQLDAFTTRRFAGNPAAVVVLEEFVDDAVLQAVAAENNLAETAFVVPSAGGYRLRWFTPTLEVPLCGHATLAAGAVVLERLEPGRDSVVFDTASGPLTVDREGPAYRMDLPVRTVRPVPPPPALSAALGVTPLEMATRTGTTTSPCSPTRTPSGASEPDLAAIARLDRTGVVVTATGDGGTTSSAATSPRPRGSPRTTSPAGRTAGSCRSGRLARARTRSSPTRRRRAAASWPAGWSATGCSCRAGASFYLEGQIEL